ncbi:NIPSNAP family protein [Pelagibacterium nitratireducens]|uniref:NIPSNAP family protein n=1 Tax=Pelagibacterium nitratireducens TaxID=1046114 RepID=A0ABZ2I6U1_9HYPH
MFVEQRVYTLRPGTTSAFIDYYGERGRAVQIAHLGNPVGYYFTEVGSLNQMVMNWYYASLDERAHKRQQLASDPDWVAYLEHARECVTTQQTSILKPAPFFTEQLQAYISRRRNS